MLRSHAGRCCIHRDKRPPATSLGPLHRMCVTHAPTRLAGTASCVPARTAGEGLSPHGQRSARRPSCCAAHTSPLMYVLRTSLTVAVAARLEPAYEPGGRICAGTRYIAAHSLALAGAPGSTTTAACMLDTAGNVCPHVAYMHAALGLHALICMVMDGPGALLTALLGISLVPPFDQPWLVSTRPVFHLTACNAAAIPAHNVCCLAWHSLQTSLAVHTAAASMS
jgi:hypothetical protein